jgi:hypothetical protein
MFEQRALPSGSMYTAPTFTDCSRLSWTLTNEPTIQRDQVEGEE